ncbi:MAG: hypothetical protein P1V81_04630 [Planctomycetota bacterium]|nr:hypothetical protein [Planctomycetota bacterium]
MRTTTLALAGFSAFAAPSALAQFHAPLVPFEHTGDLFVTDSTTDSIVRCVDLDLNGDFNGPGETTVFYSDTIGTQSLGNNNSLAFDYAGNLYVSDTSEDAIFRLADANGNGDCHDPGELTVFFDGDPGVNLSGLEMVSPNRVTVDLLGNVWVAEANNSAGIDSILKLSDLNADGDANDVGEAVRYYQPITAGSTGDSIPNAVVVGQDARLYYVEGGSTGFVPKAVYRLDDADGSGLIDPLTEVTTFFTPPAQANTPFFWCLAQDSAGYFYTADSGNELIWRFRDDNSDGVIDPMTEASIWWQTTSSLIWDLAPATGGGLYVCESQTPDRILFLFDTNGDGSVDPLTETTEVYSDLLGSVDIKNPRGMALERRPTLEVTATVAVGGTVNANTYASVGDLIFTWWSGAQTAPLALAPFGFLELAAGPGSGLLYTGIVMPPGAHSAALTLPSDPTLSGLTLYTQGFVGKPDRFQLTNLQATTVL